MPFKQNSISSFVNFGVYLLEKCWCKTEQWYRTIWNVVYSLLAFKESDNISNPHKFIALFQRICYVYVFNQILIVQMSINKVWILRSVTTKEHLSLITIYILLICLSALNYYIFCSNITNLWCLPNIVVTLNVSCFGFVSLLRLFHFCYYLCHYFPFTSLVSARSKI